MRPRIGTSSGASRRVASPSFTSEPAVNQAGPKPVAAAPILGIIPGRVVVTRVIARGLIKIEVESAFGVAGRYACPLLPGLGVGRIQAS